MKYQHVILISQLFIFGIGIVSANNCYGAQFSEDVWSCEGFENKVIQCDTLKLKAVEGNEAELGLSGVLVVKEELEDGIEVDVEIWKILDIGAEFMYHISGDLCSSLEKDNTAWYPLVQSMNINKCPIAVNDYPIKDMTINLNHSKSILNHELCGEYKVRMEMIKKGSTEKESCYEMGLTINEHEC